VANLITGDAITLDLRIAGLPSRSLALAVDLTIQVALLLLGTVLASWVFSAGGSPGAQAALTLIVVVLALVGWPTLVETLTRGRSVGKMLMGLRVVRDDGGPVRMRHSLVRALAMVFLDFWVTSGVVGGLSALTSSTSKRMGDHLAGTIVVGERIPRASSAHQEITMPVPLSGWAAGLDLVALPDTLVLNVRTFLHRAPTLDPTVRVRTAERLATQVAGHVRTPAPAGTPAEAYLAAVLAERTRRAAPGASPTGQVSGWGPDAAPTAGRRPAGPPPAQSPAPPTAAAEPPIPHAPPPTTAPTGFTLPR
jgi:uncharacterized RDD family membrane protein YckC